MQTFKCRLLLRIHGCSASASTLDIIVSRETELPFAPYKGFYLQFDGNEVLIDDRKDSRINRLGQLYESVAMCQITWIVDSQQFEIWLPSNKEIYWAELDGRPHRSVEEIAKEYEEMGFSVMERWQ